ncbi:unnamed protein product [Protopolystoma xenopodis]|uniref:FH2 domain-containing protein n=1 Tax=Protopolystoma xenopodis TaxID=117903 RepID=A0A3S5BCZ1_9PLAT|nr:unnamed protein product [Protopolystoma xenopodis]
MGGAAGFAIDSLLKLSDIRSNNPRVTLLHFLIQVSQDGVVKTLFFRRHQAPTCGRVMSETRKSSSGRTLGMDGSGMRGPFVTDAPEKFLFLSFVQKAYELS